MGLHDLLLLPSGKLDDIAVDTANDQVVSVLVDCAWGCRDGVFPSLLSSSIENTDFVVTAARQDLISDAAQGVDALPTMDVDTALTLVATVQIDVAVRPTSNRRTVLQEPSNGHTLRVFPSLPHDPALLLPRLRAVPEIDVLLHSNGDEHVLGWTESTVEDTVWAALLLFDLVTVRGVPDSDSVVVVEGG
jgi:hypothetical protein